MSDLTDRLRATGIEACVRYTTGQIHLPNWRRSEPTYVAEILDAADACIAALLDELAALKERRCGTCTYMTHDGGTYWFCEGLEKSVTLDWSCADWEAK